MTSRKSWHAPGVHTVHHAHMLCSSPIWRVIVAVLATVACMASLACAGVVVPAAIAAGNSSSTSGSTVSALDDDDDDDTASTSTVADKHTGVTMSIAQSTAVVTATSGYHLSATIVNNTETTRAAGTLTVAYNPTHIFVSRADMQHWAQSDVAIPTKTVLGQVAVPQIPAGDKVTVSVDAAADSAALKAIVVWGPKPLQVTYGPRIPNTNGTANDSSNENDSSANTANNTDSADATDAADVEPIQLHSFLTRSADGLSNAATPAMSITMVTPMTSTTWQANTAAINALVSQSDNSSTSSSSKSSGSANSTHANGKSSNNTNGSTGSNASENKTDTNNADTDTDTDTDSNNTADDSSSATNSANNNNSAGATSDGATSSESADSQQNQQSQNSANSSSQSQSQSSTAQSSSGVATPKKNGTLTQLQQVIAKHASLQVVADPTLAHATGQSTRVNAVMQPAGFDITAYAAKNEADSYENAGVSTTDWSAQSALNGITSTGTTIAWQGSGDWTLQALTAAKQQGYGMVIAAHDFDSSATATVHTGKYVVPTDAGEVTVLAEQQELGKLAKGKATSSNADSEQSAAGRIARFVAQSAFYQMEQPYTTRNLLVCFGENTSPAVIDTLMTALEQSSWLQLTSLDQLANAEAYQTGDTALKTVPQNSKLSAKRSQTLNSTLRDLTASRKDIDRFASSVLTEASASTKAAKRWMSRVRAAHTTLALHALSQHAGNEEREGLIQGATNLGSGMLAGVRITPTESISVVSETAKMPVTISNDHPYPVHVKVSSLTDSMEIVTSRFTEADVPAHGETQVTFTIRVATSGRTTAHINLMDRNDKAFGVTQDTSITSVLRISDMSGFLMIGFSLLLGVLGLWRQFHRKKDPDE